MISTCGHQKRLCCTFTKSCPTIFTNLRDLTILLGVDIVCKPNVKYLFLAILMHCIELHFLTIALDAVICNLIAMVDAFAKFHRLHVGVVDCRMWVISRRLTMRASCCLCWLCVQHVTECIDTCCIAAAGEIVVQVEVEACWLWSWDCCLLTWQGDKVKWHFLKRECVQGGEGGWGENRFPIRLISKQFQMLPHTPHPDLKYILGTASFSFSYFTSDFYQALDLCSCAMRYVILYLRNLNSIVA